MGLKPLSTVATISVLVVLHVIKIPSLLAFEPDTNKCGQRIYRGPDSRLKAHILGKVSRGSVVGFEILNHRPVIALPHSLLAMEKNTVVELPIPQTIKAISVSGGHDLLLQTDAGIAKGGDQAFMIDHRLTRAIRGRLYSSGSQVFLEVRTRLDFVQFVARRLNGQSFTIATMKGPFRAASWNQYGLAAVVDDSLFIWDAGSKNVVRLLSDHGLNSARDVALVGPARAVVALGNIVVLVTSETMTVVAPASAARCRFGAGILYLLDTGTGIVWAIDGLDRLGSKAGDLSYARTLIRNLPNDANEKSAQFREAARMVGCDAALHELAEATAGNTFK